MRYEKAKRLMGNIYNAGVLAEKRNRAMDRRYREEILSSLAKLTAKAATGSSR
jgi:hypothetical protein